jgi:FAD:protein FMN transferase
MIQMVTELRFPAMGTEAHVVIVGGSDDLMAVATARTAELERRWSRFLPDSEINRVNRNAGRPVAVSTDTFLLVSRSVEAWKALGGAFDPTVLASMHALGYDRTFVDIVDGPVGELLPTRGCADIVLDPQLRTVRLPIGIGLDPGGIGKGLAADVVTAELMNSGAKGVCVNLGGDLRVEGISPTGDGWALGIADPYRADRVLSTVTMSTGAMVTSTTLERAWVRNGRRVHHLINPLTGAPAESDLTTVTVLNDRAWWAEAVAKAALITGSAVAVSLIAAVGATGVLVSGPDQFQLLPGLDQAIPLVPTS